MVPGALRSTRVLSVACGETHTLCVASGGLAYAFGSGEAVLGIFEGCSRVDEPTVVPATRLEPVDRVFAGRRTSAAITARGTALMSGRMSSAKNDPTKIAKRMMATTTPLTTFIKVK